MVMVLGGSGTANGITSFSDAAAFASDLTINRKAVVNYTPATADNAAIYVATANTQGGTGYADFLKVQNISHPGVTNPNKTFRLNSTGGIEVINSAYSANLLTVSNEGYVLKPNHPMCSLYHSTTTGYTNALIQWTSSHDPLSMYSGSPNYRVTVPVAGRYLVSCHLLLNSGSGGPLSTNIRKNGTPQIRFYSSAGYTYQEGGSTLIINCAANDYLDCFQDSGATIYGGDIGVFMVMLIG